MRLSTLFILSILVFLTACGDDEDCTQADWIGSYTGTEVCNGEDAVDAIINISANGTDMLDIEVISNGATVTVPTVDFSGWSIDATAEMDGSTLAMDANLDGTDLEFNTVFTVVGFGTSNCTYSVSGM